MNKRFFATIICTRKTTTRERGQKFSVNSRSRFSRILQMPVESVSWSHTFPCSYIRIREVITWSGTSPSSPLISQSDLFSTFCLRHVSWPRVPLLITDLHLYWVLQKTGCLFVSLISHLRLVKDAYRRWGICWHHRHWRLMLIRLHELHKTYKQTFFHCEKIIEVLIGHGNLISPAPPPVIPRQAFKYSRYCKF